MYNVLTQNVHIMYTNDMQFTNLKNLMQNHHRLPHGTFDGMDKEEEVLVLPMKSHNSYDWQLQIDILGSQRSVYTIYSTKSV